MAISRLKKKEQPALTKPVPNATPVVKEADRIKELEVRLEHLEARFAKLLAAVSIAGSARRALQ